MKMTEDQINITLSIISDFGGNIFKYFLRRGVSELYIYGGGSLAGRLGVMANAVDNFRIDGFFGPDNAKVVNYRPYLFEFDIRAFQAIEGIEDCDVPILVIDSIDPVVRHMLENHFPKLYFLDTICMHEYYITCCIDSLSELARAAGAGLLLVNRALIGRTPTEYERWLIANNKIPLWRRSASDVVYDNAYAPYGYDREYVNACFTEMKREKKSIGGNNAFAARGGGGVGNGGGVEGGDGRGDGEDDFGVTVAADCDGPYVNCANGMRETAGLWPEPEMVRNIYFLGHTVAFGVGVDDGGTIESHLQRIIKERPANDYSKYNVLNYANSYNGDVFEIPRLLRRLPLRQGDIVICLLSYPGSVLQEYRYHAHIGRIAPYFERPHDLGEIFIDTLHMNSRGYGQYAEAIYDSLVEEGLIRKPLGAGVANKSFRGSQAREGTGSAAAAEDEPEQELESAVETEPATELESAVETEPVVELDSTHSKSGAVQNGTETTQNESGAAQSWSGTAPAFELASESGTASGTVSGFELAFVSETETESASEPESELESGSVIKSESLIESETEMDTAQIGSGTAPAFELASESDDITNQLTKTNKFQFVLNELHHNNIDIDSDGASSASAQAETTITLTYDGPDSALNDNGPNPEPASIQEETDPVFSLIEPESVTAPRDNYPSVDFDPGAASDPDLFAYLIGLAQYGHVGVTQAGAVVLKSGPFTYGHRHLVEYAASLMQHIYVFIAEDEKSVFPFDDRLQMARGGTSYLTNATVIPGGRYIITQKTVETRMHNRNTSNLITGMEADLEIFARYIATALNITAFFTGDKPPDDFVAQQYDTALRTVLPRYGVEFKPIPTREYAGSPITASRVRSLLRVRRFSEIEKLVPPTTLSYLREMYEL